MRRGSMGIHTIRRPMELWKRNIGTQAAKRIYIGLGNIMSMTKFPTGFLKWISQAISKRGKSQNCTRANAIQ